jgi:hypothetical protein
LAANASDDFGDFLAVQLWVDNAAGGPVNISNITVDGTGNGVTCSTATVVGVFYQNSSGTVNHVATRNQKGGGCSDGIWAEGGTASPTVTIENSSVHDVDSEAIFTQTNATTPELTATIKANDIAGSDVGIELTSGANTTVSGNFISSSSAGIDTNGGAAGSVSGNTVMNTNLGILMFGDGVSVTANRLLNSSQIGIEIGTSVATVQANTITNAKVGIDFECHANPNVIHNTINEAQTGIDKVPGVLAAPNTYFSVPTIRTGC